MRIGIELNGVLRDTIGKIKNVYEKIIQENEEQEELTTYSSIDTSHYEEFLADKVIEKFKYEIKSEITSLNLMEHLSFASQEDLYKFIYEEHAMSIFGHAQSSEYSTFHDLQEIYLKYRDKHDLSIVSDEMGKSKPASLFFISKFGCQIEKVRFYSEFTINSMWDEVDILLTANPDLSLNHPQNKIVVKYETIYNKHVPSSYSISTLKDFDNVLENILKNY